MGIAERNLAKIIQFVPKPRKATALFLPGTQKIVYKMFDEMPDGIFAVDKSWRILYLNREAERVAMQRREDVLGKHLWEEYPSLVGSEIYNHYTYAMKNQDFHDFRHIYEPLQEYFHTMLYPNSEGLTILFRSIRTLA